MNEMDRMDLWLTTEPPWRTGPEPHDPDLCGRPGCEECAEAEEMGECGECGYDYLTTSSDGRCDDCENCWEHCSDI